MTLVFVFVCLFVVCLLFQIKERPTAVQVKVTEAPSTTGGGGWWAEYYAAIIVPVAFVLFLLLVLMFIKCKEHEKKRKKQVAPLKQVNTTSLKNIYIHI